MPDFEGFGRSPGDQPSLEAIARTDRFLDALATRESVDVVDPDDEVLAALLEEWRDDLRWPPASALVSEQEAAAALQVGLAARQRTRRALAMVGSAAAAVLALGGFGAMVGTAHPGDALYGVHAMLFGEPSSAHDDAVELAAKTELAEVQQMIAQGQWDQAQNKLAAVSSTVQSVNDSNRKQGLIDQVNQLNAKVATRDPNATLTPSSSGSVSPSASATMSGASSTTESAPPEATSSTSPSATGATTTVTTTGPASASTPSSSPVASSPPSTVSSPSQQTAAGTTSTNSAPTQSPSQVVSVTPTTPSAAPPASSSVTKAGETAAQTTPATSPALSPNPQPAPAPGG
jgi:hypothetical protein